MMNSQLARFDYRVNYLYITDVTRRHTYIKYEMLVSGDINPLLNCEHLGYSLVVRLQNHMLDVNK